MAIWTRYAPPATSTVNSAKSKGGFGGLREIDLLEPFGNVLTL